MNYLEYYLKRQEEDSKAAAALVILLLSPFACVIKGALLALGAWLMLSYLGAI